MKVNVERKTDNTGWVLMEGKNLSGYGNQGKAPGEGGIDLRIGKISPGGERDCNDIHFWREHNEPR